VVAPPCHPFRSADLQILAIEQAEDERVVEELLDLGHPAWILKQLADARFQMRRACLHPRLEAFANGAADHADQDEYEDDADGDVESV